MPIPYVFSNIPNGNSIPLSYLDDNFSYLESQVSSIDTQISSIDAQILVIDGQISTIDSQILSIDAQIVSIQTEIESQWDGKSIVVLGDSISSLFPWFAEFAVPLGATVTNYSRNGRTMSNVLTNPDGTPLTSSNFTGVDAVNLLCGVNDAILGYTLGTINDAAGAATFYGKTKQVVETLLGWNNTATLVVNTFPYYNFFDGVSTINYYTTSVGGYYGYQYNDALRDVARYYGLYLNDLFYTTQFNAITINLFAGGAGTPPYPGSANLPGTVSTSSTSVTGSGTNFLTFFRLGDRIIINSEVRQIMALPSNTSMTVDVAFSTSYSNQNYQKQYYAGDGLHPTAQGYQMMTNATKGFYTGLIYSY